MSYRFPVTFLMLASLLVTGCRDKQITAYRAPKDPVATATPPAMASTNSGALPEGHPAIDGSPSSPTQSAPGGMAGTAVPTASGSDLTWTAPSTWTVKPNGAMRKGSFGLKGAGGEADLSITAFPGATGGLEANLNRWRGQVGLSPQAPAEVTAAAEKFSANGLDFIVVDYAGGGNRLVGAIVPYGGNSWFFKLMGPDAVVAAQKDAFREFLHTVKEPAAPSAQPQPQPAPAPVSMANTPVPTASGSGLTWIAPAAWTAKPNGSMRKGSFAIKGDGGEADLGITAFPGATGGLEANLNRWRGQVGLPPQAPAEVTAAVEKFSANGLDFLVVDYAGGGNRLIGAIVPYGGNSWFFKLMGPDALVAAQKETFREFLHSVKEATK